MQTSLAAVCVASFNVGQRLQVGGERATVRYVGPVEGQTGDWAGLEWDNAVRGKHDGTVGGHRYFRCISTERAGTMVRLPKLLQTARCGGSVLEGIQARYQEGHSGTSEGDGTKCERPCQFKPDSPTNEQSAITSEETTGHASNGHAIEKAHASTQPEVPGAANVVPEAGQNVGPVQGRHDFRLVGERDVRCHQSQLRLLYKASLVGMPVSHAGLKGQLAAAVPNLVELDLSSTLVASWIDAATIAAALPALRVLDLSHTRMTLPLQHQQHVQQQHGLHSQPVSSQQQRSAGEPQQQSQLRDWGDGGAQDSMQTLRLAEPVAANLRTLVLNDCFVTWQQVMATEGSVPQLEALHLCSNRISDVTPPVAAQSFGGNSGAGGGMRLLFPQLKVLDLADNQLSRWEAVRQVGVLPCLTALNVSSNRLPDLQEPLNQGRSFSALRALVCAANDISQWRTVDLLARLPGLQEARLTGNPLLSDGAAAARSGVVARMSGLRLLNGSVVDPAERRDCELHYLRTLLATADTPQQLASLEEAHPALAELRVKYGEMDGIRRAAGDEGVGRDGGGGPPLHSDLRALKLVLVRGDGGGSGADIFDERDGANSSTASVGGRDNNASFLNGGGGGAFSRRESYEDDVPRCTVDVSGSPVASYERNIPGSVSLEGLKFLVSRLLGVAPHAQHLLVVAPPAASEAAPDTRFVRSLIDAKDTDTLKDLEIEDGCDIRVLRKAAPWEEQPLRQDLMRLRAILSDVHRADGPSNRSEGITV